MKQKRVIGSPAQGLDSPPAWLAGSSFPSAGSTNSFCEKRDHAHTKNIFLSPQGSQRGVFYVTGTCDLAVSLSHRYVPVHTCLDHHVVGALSGGFAVYDFRLEFFYFCHRRRLRPLIQLPPLCSFDMTVPSWRDL